MPTKLSKPISRETAYQVKGRAVVVTVAPLRGQAEARIGFRLKGQRVQYVSLVSDLYRISAVWYGNRQHHARRAARKNGIPWKTARKQFIATNSIKPETKD